MDIDFNEQSKPRQRSSAMAVTTRTKQRLSKDFGDITLGSSKEKFTSYIREKFGLGSKETEESNFMDVPAPVFQGVNKNIKSNIYFAESANLVDLGFAPEFIPNRPTTLDFKSLLSKFDESKIDEFEIQDLLNFDFEAISNVKEKLNELIDKTSLLVNSNVDGNPEENSRRSQTLVFLCNKQNVRLKNFMIAGAQKQ